MEPFSKKLASTAQWKQVLRERDVCNFMYDIVYCISKIHQKHLKITQERLLLFTFVRKSQRSHNRH